VSRIEQGRIVWAMMRDPQGRNQKLRPGVIISDDDEIARTNRIFVIAITGTFSDPLDEWEVRLPWNRSGTTATRLKKPVVAVCNWLIELKAEDVESFAGIVPPTILEEILKRVTKD